MLAWYRSVAPLAFLGLSVPAISPAVDLDGLRGEAALARYLDAETALGRARCYAPEDAARVLAAVVWDVVVQDEGDGRLLRSLSVYWGGMAPREHDEAPPSSRPPPASRPPTQDAAAV